MELPKSARVLTEAEVELVALARTTIDANTDAELVALGAARATGAREITTIVAVGNHGRGVVGPCGRDRQILFDYHPGVRVVLPTPEGDRSILIEDLMPLAAVWSVEGGTQRFDNSRFTN